MAKKPHKAILLILRRRVIYFLWHVKIIKHGGGQDFERAHLLVASRLGIFPNTLSQQTCAQPINHLLLMWEDLISIFCSVTAKKLLNEHSVYSCVYFRSTCLTHELSPVLVYSILSFPMNLSVRAKLSLNSTSADSITFKFSLKLLKYPLQKKTPKKNRTCSFKNPSWPHRLKKRALSKSLP